MTLPRQVEVAAALWRRFRWARRDELRVRLWGGRHGYQAQPRPGAGLLLAEGRAVPAPGPPPEVARLGVLEADAAAACARFLGLVAEAAGPGGPTALVERAAAEGWPMLAASPAAIADLPEPAAGLLAGFVRRGGTLFLAGEPPPALGGRLGLDLPVGVEWPGADAVRFPAAAADVARELAGTRIATGSGGRWLRPPAGARALAFGLASGGERPVVVEQALGIGRVVVSALPAAAAPRLAEALGGPSRVGLLAMLMQLRRVFGQAAWHPPAVLANLTVDDPALRDGRLGLPYDAVLARAREDGLHVTIATIPGELPLAEARAVDRLRRHPDVLSACYHGCDHDGYEFYLPSARRMRHGARPLDRQRAALRRACAHGRRFARRHGHALDRVMVFPHGVGPAAILPDLRGLGFLAACNLGDRYPLAAPVPDDADLGLRPADVAWAGFPLLWRREVGDAGLALDLFLGRPALGFAHRRDLLPEARLLTEHATAVRRAAGGGVLWRGIEEVARHAYLQRLDPEDGWQVLMTADEACLHNPGPAARTYRVRRPNSCGRSLTVEGGRLDGGRPQPAVTVPPAKAALLRLVAPGAEPTPLPGRPWRCSFPSREWP